MTTQIVKLFLALTFVFSIAEVNAQCPPSKFAGVHVVSTNETLFSIARTYGVSVDEICTWNSISKEQPLSECKSLVVSQSLVNPAPSNSWVMSRNGQIIKQDGQWHTVRKGESAAQIAYAYGYTEQRFREFNDLPAWKILKAGAVVRSSECACETVAPSKPAKVVPSSFSNSDPIAKTARKAPSSASDDRGYMKVDESEMIDEINLMRSNPAGYVKYVQEYVRQQKNTWNYTVSPTAVNSLIRDLRKSPKLSTLRPHKCLYQMAQTHGDYLYRTKGFSHSDANGTGPWSRTLNTCPQVKLSTTKNSMGMLVGNENLVAGNSTVRESVITLLIDAGINPPGHRETLLAPEWNYVACYNFGEVNGMPNNFVQNFGR